MRPIFWKSFFIIAVALLLAEDSYSQAAKIEPEQPRWGQTLTVTYNPKAEGAKLSLTDEVYVVGFLSFSDHSSKKVWAKMSRAGDAFKHELPLTDHLAFVAFHFLSPDGWDARSSVGAMIYRPDGIPARGAHEEKMTSPHLTNQYKELFEKERALYPDNFAAYRTKWFVAGAFDQESLVTLIAQDLEGLTKQVKDESPDLLYSLSYGYLLLKQEEKSREILRKLITHYPASPLVGEALDDYEYQVFAQQIKGEGPKEVETLKREFIQRFPHTEFARHQVGFKALARQEDFPLAALEEICRLWIKDEPDDPMPYFNLALAYNVRQRKFDSASTLIEKAINLILEGKLRLYEDISGQLTRLLLPSAYRTSAEIALQQRNYAQALAAIKAAQTLSQETAHTTYTLEGKIWQELSNPSRAEAAYLEAWRRGSRDVEGFLKALYEKRRGGLAGFEEYLSKAKAGPTDTRAAKKLAPSFRVTSLEGKTFDLTALRGKVVVLNFWFIGCAPCRVEIPGLNKLVEEFKDKDVVFLAFANDDEKSLRAFLKEVTFTYHIIPNAQEIAKQFEVTAFPTHIVINKDGQIEAFLTGGSENRHDDLRPLIERALGK